VVSPTPLVVRNFVSWLRSVFPPDFDFGILGIDLEEPRTISKFLREFCPGISSRKCRERLLAVYGGIAGREGERRWLEGIRNTLLERFGTAQVAEAFRALYRRYGEGVRELLLLEDHGELKCLEDALHAEYGCIDVDIRKLSELERWPEMEFGELAWLGPRARLVDKPLERLTESLEQAGFMRVDDPAQLAGYPRNLGVASRVDDMFLVCVLRYGSNSLFDRLTIVASSSEPFVLLNLSKKRYGVLT